LHLNRTEEALACFEQCWSQSSRARAEFGKAAALQVLRRFDQAEAAYERALAADPRLDEALSNLIAMSMEVFDLSRIHRYALRLLDLLPHSAIALQALTLVALERREFEEAAYYFGRFQERARETAHGLDSEEAIEYRLSEEVVARLNQMIGHRPGAGHRILRAARPAGHGDDGRGETGWRQ
jgi:tetratricopeptide (TPR) repeat protein